MKDDIVNIPEHPGGAGITEDKVPHEEHLYLQDKVPNTDPSMIDNEDWKNYKPNGPQEVQLETHGETAQDPLVQFNNNMHPTNDLTGAIKPNQDPTLVGTDWKENNSSYSDAHDKQKRVFQREITQLKVAPKKPKALKTGIPIFIGTSDHKCDRIQEKIIAYTLQKKGFHKGNVGPTSTKGNSGSHSHNLSSMTVTRKFTGSALSLDVQYIDVIVATKN